MQSVEVQDLKERINELLRMVKEEGETVEVTDQGKVVARVIPASEPKQIGKQDLTTFWDNIHRLAEQVGTYLPEKVDAVEIVREGRREL